MQGDDVEIVRGLRAGSREALKALFEMWYGPLHAFALRFVDTPAAAEDVVHDTFLRLWETRERLVVRTSLRAYLYGAVRNRCLNLRKRWAVERRYEQRALADPSVLPGPWDADPAGGAPSAHEAPLDDDALRDAVRQAIDDMPERRRLVAQLRWWGGLSYQEIADVVGISVKGVENALARALKQLRERFGPEG